MGVRSFLIGVGVETAVPAVLIGGVAVDHAALEEVADDKPQMRFQHCRYIDEGNALIRPERQDEAVQKVPGEYCSNHAGCGDKPFFCCAEGEIAVNNGQ